MGIKLTAFMTAYKFKKTPEEKKEFVASHIKHEYIPFEMKADTAKAIVDVCYYRNVTDADGNVRKEFHVDSIAKYMLYNISLIDLFTDIERQKNDGKILEDFNTLNRSGVLDYIINSIDNREIKEFRMILEAACNDIMVNEYEPHAYIRSQFERFGELIGNTLSPVLKEIDMNKIKEVISQIGG